MIPFVAGVLSGMALKKIFGDNEENPAFEPVAMREISEEYVKETLSKANKTLQIGGTSIEKISAKEISADELPSYIRDKLIEK